MASPGLQQAVTSIHLNNYGTLMVITAVGYDYILTLSREIEYIWNKRWTWVSTLFILARYFGMLSVVSTGVWGTSFFPDSAEVIYPCDDQPRQLPILTTGRRTCLCIMVMAMDVSKQMVIPDRCNKIYVFGLWCICIYICAADLVMILRVWALYNRSKLILGTLLTLYGANVVSFLVYYIVFSARFRHHTLVGTTQVLEFSFCISKVISTPMWAQALASLQIVLGALMCLLTAIRFVKEALQMYKVTKQFRLNRYMKLLVREGVIYFVVILAFALFNVMANAGINTADGWLTILTSALQQIPPFTLVPRFILSLRELYAHDLRRRRGDIDTAFGFRSGSSMQIQASMVVLEDAEQGEAGGVNGIEMEEVLLNRRRRPSTSSVASSVLL